MQSAKTALRKGYDMIVAAGGDGTLNEVVNGVREDASAVVLGLIPLGTGNDFARTLDLPTDIDQAIDLLLAGHTRAIDLVRVTSDVRRYFVNVSTGGFSGLVDEKLTPAMKKTWGPLAYLRSAAAALPEFRAHRTTVSLDNAESLTLNLFGVVIANGRYVGGGMRIAPEASVDDGLLDRCADAGDVVPGAGAGDEDPVGVAHAGCSSTASAGCCCGAWPWPRRATTLSRAGSVTSS